MWMVENCSESLDVWLEGSRGAARELLVERGSEGERRIREESLGNEKFPARPGCSFPTPLLNIHTDVYEFSTDAEKKKTTRRDANTEALYGSFFSRS